MDKRFEKLLTAESGADVKDGVIERAVSEYTGCIIPPRPSHRVIDALEQNKAMRENRRRKRFRLFAAAAAVLAVFVIGFQFINSFADKRGNASVQPPASYSIYSLNRAVASDAELEKSGIIAAFTDKSTGAEIRNAKIFYASDRADPVVLAVDIFILVEAGTEKITIIADFKRGLNDYSSYIGNKSGSEFYFRTKYVNGEYVSTGFAALDDADYYVDIMSPAPDAVERYFI